MPRLTGDVSPAVLRPGCVSLSSAAPHVRFGSKADIGLRPALVRPTSKSGPRRVGPLGPLCAKRRHGALNSFAPWLCPLIWLKLAVVLPDRYAIRRPGCRISRLGVDLVTSMIAQEVIEVVPVADLVPTQMTVGMREVIYKRRRWRERSSDRAANYPKQTSHSGCSGPKLSALFDRSPSPYSRTAGRRYRRTHCFIRRKAEYTQYRRILDKS